MARRTKGLATPKAARRRERKRKAGIQVRRKKEFTYRGMTIDKLRELTFEEFIAILHFRIQLRCVVLCCVALKCCAMWLLCLVCCCAVLFCLMLWSSVVWCGAFCCVEWHLALCTVCCSLCVLVLPRMFKLMRNQFPDVMLKIYFHTLRDERYG